MGESFRNLTVWQRSVELTLAVYAEGRMLQ
jgi:hypothetical protein